MAHETRWFTTRGVVFHSKLLDRGYLSHRATPNKTSTFARDFAWTKPSSHFGDPHWRPRGRPRSSLSLPHKAKNPSRQAQRCVTVDTQAMATHGTFGGSIVMGIPNSWKVYWKIPGKSGWSHFRKPPFGYDLFDGAYNMQNIERVPFFPNATWKATANQHRSHWSCCHIHDLLQDFFGTMGCTPRTPALEGRPRPYRSTPVRFFGVQLHSGTSLPLTVAIPCPT